MLLNRKNENQEKENQSKQTDVMKLLKKLKDLVL